MSLTMAGLAALAFALSFLGGKGHKAHTNEGMQDNGIYNTRQGWFSNTSNSDIEDAFRQYMIGQGEDPDYVNQLSSGQIATLLKENYEDGGWNVLGLGNTGINFEDAYKDALKMQNTVTPLMPDYDEIYNQAQQTIAAENAEVNALYDQLLGQQTDSLNAQLTDLNNSYQDTTNQILSSDYIKSRQLMDSAQSELSQSRRNALEAGASAGLRLANNVNVMLSNQNRQAQQSLETSNNLAQMMLNQRQAASGIRGDYYNALSNNTAQRAALKQGTAERTNSYANQRFQTEDSRYNNRMAQWKSTYGDNPWSDSYLGYDRRQRQNNFYGG